MEHQTYQQQVIKLPPAAYILLRDAIIDNTIAFVEHNEEAGYFVFLNVKYVREDIVVFTNKSKSTKWTSG